MQDIINRLNSLSLDNNEEEIEITLSEVKKSLIQNVDLHKTILNENFLKSIENWIQFDNLVPLCQDILELSLTNHKFTDGDDFGIIEAFLNSSHKKLIAVIAIRKLQRECNEIAPLCPKSTILLLIESLKSPHVNIGPPTINLLIQFLHDGFLDDPDIKFQLTSALSSENTEVSCRIYEVAVEIAVKRYSSFEKVKFIIEKAIQDLSSGNDILLQMNLLEILQSLCHQDYGFAFLESKDVLKNLSLKIEDLNEDPMNALMIPGLMKFFGGIATNYPQMIFQNYSSLLDLLFNCLMEEQSTITYSALDTLGFLCKTNECKIFIDKYFGHKFTILITHIYNSAVNYPSDVKIRAFLCLENIFSLDENEEMTNNQIVYICEKWCNAIFGQSSDFVTLLNFCKSPFDDIAQSAFGFLKSLVKFSFGQKKVEQSAGFIEFLLDRKIGVTYELKQKKYEVIEILARSSVFNASTIAQFSKYVREGVNYVEPISEVSFDPS